MWFMPVNILITFIIESILGWILVKITRAPKNLEGNLENLPIIIIPAICKDKGSPFGDPDGSLATRVIKYYNKLNQKMPLIYVKLYTYQIFRALSYIHRCIGVCHCDINPQNLLLDTLTSDISNMNDVLLAKPAGLKKKLWFLWIRYDWRRDMLGLATPRNGSILQAEVLRQDSLLVSLFHSGHGLLQSCKAQMLLGNMGSVILFDMLVEQ
ncbi:hypothetical protein AHAS_Ahas16G0197300 [Arachis hypogaea]